MLRRPLTGAVLRLALPLMAANLSQTVLSLVDTMMVGRIGRDGVAQRTLALDPETAERLGRDALAAMGSASVVFLVLFLMVTAAFMGIQALTARRLGENRLDACGQVLSSGLALSVVIGLVAGVLGFAFSHPLARAITEPAGIAQQAGEYLTVRWGCILAVTLLWAYKGFFFGVGLTRVDMAVAVGMNVLNIGLNWIFIYGNLGAPRMGLAGAALASVLATATGVVCIVAYTLRPIFREQYHIYRPGSVSRDMMVRILKLSLPRTMQALAFGGSIYFFKMISHHCGPTALAASTVVWRFFGVTVLLALAFGAASATLVGQSMGAGDLQRAEDSAKEAVRLGVILITAIGAFVIWQPDLVLGLFTVDADVIALGRGPLRLLAAFQMVDGAGIILGRSLAGAGAVLYVMTAEIVISLFCMVPAVWYLTRNYPDNLTVIWGAWIVYIVFWCGAMTWKFLSGTWKKIEI